MDYIIDASIDRLFCTDFVDFGQSHDKIEFFSSSGTDTNYLDVKRKVFKKDDNKNFRLVQNLTTGSRFLNNTAD